MGKVEIGIYFCVTADILKKFYRNASGLPTIWILSKLLILIVCHDNRKAKYLKKKKFCCYGNLKVSIYL